MIRGKVLRVGKAVLAGVLCANFGAVVAVGIVAVFALFEPRPVLIKDQPGDEVKFLLQTVAVLGSGVAGAVWSWRGHREKLPERDDTVD